MFCGDLSSRAILCRLDARCEDPGAREFAVNLKEWVPAHRAEFVAAALTVIAGYVTAGEPRQPGVRTFGRFEAWERRARYPLMWLGIGDPCETRERIEVGDPDRQSLRAMLDGWYGVFAAEPATVAEAVKATAVAPEGSASEALREAMLTVAADKGAVNTRRLGRWLMRFEGRAEQGKRFVRCGQLARAIRWLAQTPDAAGEFMSLNEFASSPPREEQEERQKDKNIKSGGLERNSQKLTNSLPDEASASAERDPSPSGCGVGGDDPLRIPDYLRRPPLKEIEL
jgi:hypothetical protein